MDGPFIAAWLSARLQRIVTAEPGPNPHFDFAVDLPIDTTDLADPNVSERDSITHLFQRLPEKLGLKLQTQTRPVETLTVDHAERPSQN